MRKMRLLLVAPDLNYLRPAWARKATVPFWARPILRIAGINTNLASRMAAFPPLGLLTVAGLTPTEHRIRLIDEAIEDIDFDSPADLVGITCNTPTSPRAYQIADQFKARGIPVILGGMHPSALPEEALEHADAVVIGEAENVWPKLLSDFETGRLRQIYKNDVFPPLGNFPFPRRDLLKREAYWIPNTVQTTRGCPNNCEFCSVTAFFGRTYRTRPVEEVIAEVESLQGDLVVFVDDNIMAVPEYSTRLFEALIRSPKKIRWYGQAALTMMKHPELLVLAKRSGCRGLFIGLESIFPRILKKMGKPFNQPSLYQRAIDKLHSLGIRVIGAFVFGEQDTPQTIAKTVKFTLRAKLDLVQYALATPLPGTRLWQRLVRVEGDCSKYDGRHITFQHPYSQQLQEAFNWAYRKTYTYFSIVRRLLTPKGDWPTFLALNFAFRQGTYGWMARGD